MDLVCSIGDVSPIRFAHMMKESPGSVVECLTRD